MTDQVGVVDYGYDSRGRLVSVEREGGVRFSIRYDAGDRVVGMTAGTGYAIGYEYDFLGRLVLMQTPAGEVKYEYQTGQGIIIRTLPNRIKTFWHYRPNGELERIVHGFFENPERSGYLVLASYEYSYGLEGRIHEINEQTVRGASVLRFVYDKMGRLEKVKGPEGGQQYRYDGVGNRIMAVIGKDAPRKVEYDWMGRMQSINGDYSEHDESGNLRSVLLKDGRYQFEFDSLGQLTKVENDAKSVRFVHDGFGRLALRKAGRSETRVICNPLSSVWQPVIISELGGRENHIIWDGNTPLAIMHDGRVEWLLGDHLGSLRMIADENGKVVKSLEYDAFGVPLQTNSDLALLPGFGGLFWDEQAKIYLTRTRAYMPWIGGFLQIDPQLKIPSRDPDTLSFYAYCRNDPLNFLDRGGATPVPISQPWQDHAGGWIPKPQIPDKPWDFPPRDSHREPFRPIESMNRYADLAGIRQRQLEQQRRSQEQLARTMERQRDSQQRMRDRLSRSMDRNRRNLQAIRDQARGVGQRQLKSAIDFRNNTMAAYAGSLVVNWARAGQLALAFSGYGIPGAIAGGFFNGIGDRTSEGLQGMGIDSDRGVGDVVDLVSNAYGLAKLPGDLGGEGVLNGAVQFGAEELLGFGSALAGNTAVDQVVEAAGRPSPVGGVYLGGAGRILDGLGNLLGVAVDESGNLLIVSEDEGDVKLPPMRLDDIVTVFRSVYLNGEGPTVTIDPDSRRPKENPMKIVHSVATKGTYVGWILYQADRLMKCYNLGVDNNTQLDFFSALPEYQNVLDEIYFGNRSTSESEHWERFWIVPSKVRRFGGGSREFSLIDVPLGVKTQKMKWQGGELVDDHSSKSSPGAKKFTEWFGENYTKISQEQYLLPPPETGIKEAVPVFAELKKIASLTAIAEKLRDDGVVMPFWMREYEIASVAFEETTPILNISRKKGAYKSSIFGGVGLSPETKNLENYATPADVAKAHEDERAVLSNLLALSRQLEKSIYSRIKPLGKAGAGSFEIRQIDKDYRLLSLPGAEAVALNPCRLEFVDIAVPWPGGEDIRVVRRYNSFFRPEGSWGETWTMDLPYLEEIKVPEKRYRSSAQYKVGYELLTPLNTHFARFSRVGIVEELGRSTLLVPESDGFCYGLAHANPNFLNGDRAIVVYLKQGTEWYFSETGRLLAVKTGSRVTIYSWRSDTCLARISGLVNGIQFGEIELEYGPRDLLSRLVGRGNGPSRAKPVEVNYRYDSEGRLVEVETDQERSSYRYEEGLVAAFSRSDSDVSFKYNDRGQLLSERRRGGDIDYALSTVPAGTKLSVSSGGKAKGSIIYDQRLRPLEAIASGETVTVHGAGNKDGGEFFENEAVTASIK